MLANLVLITIILAGVGILIWFTFRKDKNAIQLTEEEDIYSIVYLTEGIKSSLTALLQSDVTKIHANKEQIERSKRNKKIIRDSMETCAFCDANAKEEMIKYIKDLLQSKFGINEETVNYTIPFTNPHRLTPRDEFDILLHIYRKTYDRAALTKFIDKNGLLESKGDGYESHYEITKSEINTQFRRHAKLVNELTFADKLTILAKRIYSNYLGHGVVDEIQDMSIDEFSGGVSGVPSTFYIYGEDASFGAPEGELPYTDFNAVWIMLHGVQVRLAFLGFGTKEELIRVTSHIYKYGEPGEMSEARPKIVSHMKDGSRVSATRPPMNESWSFWVRKKASDKYIPLNVMYPFKNVEGLVEFVKWQCRCNLNTIITGGQGSGKTTALISMVNFIPHTQTIRVVELSLEADLRRIYRTRNISSFQETAECDATSIVDFTKKSSGNTIIFGEIASADVATLGLQTGQVGSDMMLGTHHGKTTRDTVTALSKNMIETSGYTDQKMVEEEVAKIIKLDMHIDKRADGLRYVERITQIKPHAAEPYPTDLDEARLEFFRRMTDRPTFDVENVIEFIDGKFQFVNELYPETVSDMRRRLTDKELVQFDTFINLMKKDVAEYKYAQEQTREVNSYAV